MFSALFGLGDADDPDVMKRNLLIADDPENKGHKDRLTMEHRRQLCDSDRLSFQELEALMASVSEKTRPDKRPSVADRWAGAETRDFPLSNSITTDQPTKQRTDGQSLL